MALGAGGHLTSELFFSGVNRQHSTQEEFNAKQQCKVFKTVTAGHYARQGTPLVQSLCGTSTARGAEGNPAKPGVSCLKSSSTA